MRKCAIRCATIILPLLAFAGTIDYTVELDHHDINTAVVNNYDFISIKGYTHLSTPGYPQLPARAFSFIIPADAQVTDVEVINHEGVMLQGTYTVFPAQTPVPVSFSSGTEFTSSDAEVYARDGFYPSAPVQFLYEGSLSGYRIATVSVTPVQYLPAQQQLYLNTSITFRIHYERGQVAVRTIPELQHKLGRERVEALVVNSHDVLQYAPPMNRGTWDSEYIIITDASFVSAFQPLKEWKSRKGVPTEIVTTTWIYSNYTGTDNADKIRNFIIAAADSGVMYFLLGGQCDFEHGEEYVPRRDTYFYTSGVGIYSDEDTIPCDMYFSNLDGNWNGNNNSVYGEFSDNVDMYADVYVGRAPVKNTTQIDNFISKVISYEKTPSLAFVEKILLPVGNLWSGNYGNGINDTIADTIPDNWQKSKMYESYGLMSRFITRDSLNQGFNFCHYVGHGNEYGEYYNYGSSTYYYHSDALVQTNDSTEAAIANSMGCFCGGMDVAGISADKDCMAERMVNANKNCAVAAIMNSRYGWGYSSPQGNLGPSGELSVWFYRKLFGTAAYHTGEVLAAAKDQKASSGSLWWWRWPLFEYNLFGDPEMPMWTNALANLSVAYLSDTIALFGDGSPDTFTVTVTDGRAPVANALVTIMQDSTAYERLTTNSSGQAQFILPDNTFQHAGSAWVTVTHYSGNFLPDCGSAQIAQNTFTVEDKPDNLIRFAITASPNPATNHIALSAGMPVKDDVVVKIYDIQGSLIKTAVIKQGSSEAIIPTTDFSSGIYVLTSEQDATLHEKIIVVK
jgi:hypothetical protein